MKTTPLKGMKDILPREQRIRDYVQGEILKTYRAAGFERISTPIMEDMENLDKSDGGDNLNLIFKVLKRGDKLEKANVITTPGAGFGPSGEGYIRLSAFGDADATKEGVRRIEELFA